MKLHSRPAALLSLIGVMLLWPYVLTKSVSSSASLSAGQGEERPRVAKRSTQNCGGSFDKYCLNNGQCMLLVDINEHHCKCERGFYGPRCGNLEFVVQPVAEEQIVLIVFCVSLLIIGLAGALYFCCKRYKEKKIPTSAEAEAEGLQSSDCLEHHTHPLHPPQTNQDFPSFPK